MRSFAATLALAAAAVGLAAAQAPQQPPDAQQPKSTFKSTVDLVPVDVNVLDRAGVPIANLTADDFTLKVDGKPRRIASAQFITASRTVEQAPQPRDFSANPPSAGGRLIMLVIRATSASRTARRRWTRRGASSTA